MSQKYTFRLGGYGPASTSFSQALDYIGGKLEAAYGDDVDVKYLYNIMDIGYRADEIITLVEEGFLTLGYQSSSYLTSRVPELGFVDLPFLFSDNVSARAAIDGELGTYLSRKTEDRINYKILGYFENGFRHISNKLRPIHAPEDMTNMKIRVLPSDVQAQTFQLLGADPKILDLTEAIAGVTDGSLDAQENPFANTVTYGVHKFHRFHTMSNHFYISRSIFANRTAYYSWPEELKQFMAQTVSEAIAIQRGQAEQEAIESQQAIQAEGCEINELTPDELDAFTAAVKPQHDEARAVYGDAMFKMIGR